VTERERYDALHAPAPARQRPAGRAPRDVRYIALDVDGTLVGRAGVPAGVWPALDRARRAGARLGLCTGRVLAGATLELARRVDRGGPHISQSGAVITDGSGEILWSSTLDGAQLATLVELADQVGADAEWYWSDGFGTARPAPAVDRHARALGLDVEVLPTDDLAGREVTSAVWLVPQEKWPRARETLGSVPSVQIALATAPWAPGLVFANITAEGTSKGSALMRVAAFLDEDPARIAMVGDGRNDVDAMEVAGWSAAMGDAPEEVRAVADLVVPPADDGGLAVAVSWMTAGGTTQAMTDPPS
jgi:Cof subfamily protein (haloacid dehalogenase superfamily)